MSGRGSNKIRERKQATKLSGLGRRKEKEILKGVRVEELKEDTGAMILLDDGQGVQKDKEIREGDKGGSEKLIGQSSTQKSNQIYIMPGVESLGRETWGSSKANGNCKEGLGQRKSP